MGPIFIIIIIITKNSSKRGKVRPADKLQVKAAKWVPCSLHILLLSLISHI
jgi:hypothetical protein